MVRPLIESPVYFCVREEIDFSSNLVRNSKCFKSLAYHCEVHSYETEPPLTLAPAILFHVVVLESFDCFPVEHVNDVSNFEIVLPLFAGLCFNHLTSYGLSLY